MLLGEFLGFDALGQGAQRFGEGFTHVALRLVW
jgi:hypothetical protein